MGGLSADSTEDDLREYFDQFGKVRYYHTHAHTAHTLTPSHPHTLTGGRITVDVRQKHQPP